MAYREIIALRHRRFASIFPPIDIQHGGGTKRGRRRVVTWLLVSFAQGKK
jgi:hypothetical protein